MIRTKEKILTLLTCVFIALSISGFTYAQWSDTIVVKNRMRFGDLTLRFVDPLNCWDNDDATKDVGECTCEYTNPDLGGFETLEIGVTNAYPEYQAYCNFTLRNVGTLPDHIMNVTIIPGTGLEVGENYTDANGNLIGWRLDETVAGEPVLNVYVYTDKNLSLICNILNAGEELAGEIAVDVTNSAKECSTYGFSVEIIYDQVT